MSHKIDQLKQMSAGSQNSSPRAPVFKLLEIAEVGARDSLKTRHNIYEATCAKQNEWL